MQSIKWIRFSIVCIHALDGFVNVDDFFKAHAVYLEENCGLSRGLLRK